MNNNVYVQARPLLSDGKTEALVDPRLGGDYDGEQARRVAFVASLCVRAPATWRPSMTEVRASRLCRVVVRWWRSLQLTGQSRVAGHCTDARVCFRSTLLPTRSFFFFG